MAQADITNSFNIPEHYKMNSHIFKQNLVLITNLIIDDLWVGFNSLLYQQLKEKQNFVLLDLFSRQHRVEIISSITPIKRKEQTIIEQENESDVQDTNNYYNQEDISQEQYLKNLDDYKQQLNKINELRKFNDLKQVEAQVNLSDKTDNLNNSQGSNKCMHQKSPSFEYQGTASLNQDQKQQQRMSVLSPSLQNYRTIQYISQLNSNPNSNFSSIKSNQKTNLNQKQQGYKQYYASQTNKNTQSNYQVEFIIIQCQRMIKTYQFNCSTQVAINKTNKSIPIRLRQINKNNSKMFSSRI